MEAVVLVMAFALVVLWWRVIELERIVDRDARYHEWWLRSMEERKVDKETEESWEDEA